MDRKFVCEKCGEYDIRGFEKGIEPNEDEKG